MAKALSFKNNSRVKERAIRKGSLKRVFKTAVKTSKGLLFATFFLAAIETVTSVLMPLLIGLALDAAARGGGVDFNGLFAAAFMMCACILVSALSGYFSALCNNELCQRVIFKLRCSLSEKLSALPVKTVDKTAHGDYISTVVNDIEFLGDGVLLGVSQLFSGVLSILAIICFMIYINFAVALTVILLTPLSIFAAFFITKNSQKYFNKQQNNLGELTDFAEEEITAQKQLLAYNNRTNSVQDFARINAVHRESTLRATFFSALINVITRFINNIVYVTAGLLGIWVGLGLGKIASFLIYAHRFARPFNDITNILTQLQTAAAAASRVYAFLEQENESTKGALVLKSADINGAVSFENVCFSYEPAVPFIQNLNLDLKPRQKIAIVGKTGSGKTTLVNLLMRFYDINSGRITLDGYDIADCEKSSVRGCFGMVLQDTWLFGASVRENIAYSVPNASFDEIVAAAKRARCHGFIEAMEHGYDTIISESGENLSEGQRQLICIARVMLGNYKMLILDEATSSIDTRTERLIQSAFDDLCQNKTVFVIAHRLSTIVNSDVILVVDNGNVVESGSHEQLLANKDGVYHALYTSRTVSVSGALD